MSEGHCHAMVMMTKVEAGFLTFTGAPDGSNRDYSNWALLEHMSELRTVDGVLSTQWWVSTPELVDRRLYADAELATSRYLNLSLLAAPMEEAAR